MASEKTVAMLLICIVFLAVAHAIEDDFEDKPMPKSSSNAFAPQKPDPVKDKCYIDCEKHCMDAGYAGSFCTLKCENSCKQGFVLHGRRMSR